MRAIAVSPLMLIRSAGLPAEWPARFSSDWQSMETALQAHDEHARQAQQALLQALDTDLLHLPEGAARTAVYNARKRVFKGKTLPDGWIEQLPENTGFHARQWQLALETHSAAKRKMERHYRETLETNWLQLQAAAGSEQLQRSLLFASHDLLAILPVLQRTPVGQWRKKEKQAALALARYLFRGCLKTSPFSRLTTVSVRHETEAFPRETAVSIAPNVALLPALYDLLLGDPVVYQALSLRLNPCITRTESAEYRWLYFDGERESFQSAAGTPVLDALVRHALRTGRTHSFHAWRRHLQSVSDADEAACESFLLDLSGLGFLEWVLPEAGMDVRWCDRLGAWLAARPGSALAADAADLLFGLQAAAGQMLTLPVEGARDRQKQAHRQVSRFFQKYQLECPPIPPEQLFYEDAARPVRTEAPTEALEQLCAQLDSAWSALDRIQLPRMQARLTAFAKGRTEDRMTWTDFVRRVLETPPEQETDPLFGQPAAGVFGALLQVYREKGRWKAAVNALYPGGGKMMARWLHLFPEKLKDRLETWRSASGRLPFPWQGWHNANIQPAPDGPVVQVPGGRSDTGKQELLLGDLEVDLRTVPPVLRQAGSDRPLYCTDLGLEAPETRPPAIQVLGALTLPFVSASALIAPENHWEFHPEGWRFRRRIVSGDLLLARAEWRIEPGVWTAWAQVEGYSFFHNVRTALQGMGVPARFFARLPGEKPQYFDRDSPLAMLLFEKLLRQGRPAGDLSIVEMAPLPEQCVVSDTNGQYVSEWAVEWRNSEV